MRGFYDDRPHDEIEAVNMVKFLELERQCDVDNFTEFREQDFSHLSKYKTDRFLNSIKSSEKKRGVALRKINPDSKTFKGYSSFARNRTWLSPVI